MKLKKDLTAINEGLTPLERPGHHYTRLSQLARRAGDGKEDALRRLIDALAGDFGDPVVELRDRRLALTPTAKTLLKHVRALLASAQHPDADADAVETVVVAVAADVDAGLQAAVTAEFVREWGDEPVALRFQAFDPETAASAIRTGAVAFAVVWEGDAVGGERVGLGRPWTLCVPSDSPLARSEAPVTAGDLAGCRVFLPPRATAAPRIAALLAAVPLAKRVEVESAHAARAMVTAGLGVCLDLDFGRRTPAAPEPWRRRPVEGLEPEHLCLILPRNPAELLSAPALSLIDALRRALHPSAPPTEPPPAAPPDERPPAAPFQPDRPDPEPE